MVVASQRSGNVHSLRPFYAHMRSAKGPAFWSLSALQETNEESPEDTLAEALSLMDEEEGGFDFDRTPSIGSSAEGPTTAPVSSPSALAEAVAESVVMNAPLHSDDAAALQALLPGLLGLTVHPAGSYLAAAPASVAVLPLTAGADSLRQGGQPFQRQPEQRQQQAHPPPHFIQTYCSTPARCAGLPSVRDTSDGCACCTFHLAAPPSAEEGAELQAFAAEVGLELSAACKEVLEAAYSELASPLQASSPVATLVQRALSGEQSGLEAAVRQALSRAKSEVAAASSCLRRSRSDARGGSLAGLRPLADAEAAQSGAAPFGTSAQLQPL